MQLDRQSPSSSSLPGGWFVAPWQFCFLFLGGEGIGLGIGLAGAMDLSVSSSGRPLAAHQCLFPPSLHCLSLLSHRSFSATFKQEKFHGSSKNFFYFIRNGREIFQSM
jgi:hypothetical protein